MGLGDLNEEQREAVDKAKAFPRKTGRPAKEFSVIIKTAAIILKESGMSKADIARELGVHVLTVGKMLRGGGPTINPQDLEKTRDAFKGRIAEIVNKMLNAANTDEYVYNLSTSKNPGLIQAISALLEKLQLLDNKPGNISEVRETAKQLEDKLKELDGMEEELLRVMGKPKDPTEN